MAVQTVACPGCKATLKAPEQMAGKKAKCKKCGESFRIPGGPEPTGDTVGDSEMLSAMDLPTPVAPPPAANPFAFGEPEPAPPAAKSKEQPKAKPVEKLPEKKSTIKPAEKSAERKAPSKLEKALPKAPPAKPVEDEDDIPAAQAVEEEEEDPVPTAPSDPFSFSDAPSPSKGKSKERSKETPREEKKDKGKAKADEPAAGGNAFAFGDPSDSPNLVPVDDDEPPPSKGAKSSERGKAKGSKSGFTPKVKPAGGGLTTGKLILVAVVFALVVGGVVGGVLIYLNGSKQPEQVNNEKKDPPKPPDPTPPTPPDPTPPNKGETPKTPDPKEKGTPKKETTPKKPGGNTGAGGSLALAPGKTITFLPQAAKPEMVQEPNNRMMIVPTLPAKSANAFAAARRVFPPQKKDIDVGVVWQTEPGLQNVGEKLLLGLYSPQTGKQANQVVIDGDGSPEPACDLSMDANLFAHAHTGQNKITIWDTRTGAKVVDGFNPYAMKKDVKLAAVYLTEPPLFFITVSTVGDVNAYSVAAKEPKPGKFAPAKPPTKPLVAGKHVVPGADRRSVLLFAGGSFYSVTVAPDVAGTEIARLDGEVGRVFGLASGSKTVVAFETEDKKDRAVMEVRADGNHVFHRWPDKDAGEPTAVAWVDDGLVMVASNKGSCLWFESEGKDFKPIALARTPNDKAIHVASDGHWTLLPDPANPKQCVLVEYSKPQSGLVGALDSVKQPPIAILTDKGLMK